MWSAKIRRRRKALKLVKTVGSEVEQELGKSRLRQVFEIALIGLRGYSASDYYILGLYKDYTQAPRYMSRHQFDTVRRRWNPPVQGIFEFNKWIFGNYCSAVGIPTPKCYGLFHPQRGITTQGSPLRDLEGLTALMTSINGPIVFKPVAGSHGDNVIVLDHFDVATGILTRANKQRLHLGELHRILTDKPFPWLLQAKVRQHAALAELHPTSLNTARIITLLGIDGRVELLGAVLRIGTGTGEVDNTTGGGIAAPIELTDGTCGSAISEWTIRRMARHPDTGRQIEGFVVPHWDRMKGAACDAHKRLPFARSLGWDIALGEEGPTVLEVNGTWYQNHVQMTGTSLWETAFGKTPA